MMANVDLSVIIPSKNNKHKTADIIRRISEVTKGLDVEFIVIDMNSTDNSVLSALNEIKKHKLRGCVIQSGGSTVSSALNTGIYKSDGKYITFVYPSKLYKNYIPQYYKTIEENNADFVFAVPSGDKEKSEIVKKGLDNISGVDLLIGLIRSLVNIDFSAVMLNREYLLGNHIKFYEDCSYGYAEAFIYNVLLCGPKISYVDIPLRRDLANSMPKDNITGNSACLNRIDAMLKVYETLTLCHREETKLTALFEYDKLPSVVMSVVDMLLNENFSYSAIKNSLRLKHYDELLKISKITPSKLRNKILKWKITPWFYQP